MPTTGNFTVTHLRELVPDTLALGSTMIPLLPPVHLTIQLGIFSGWNRVLFYTGSAWVGVTMPDGLAATLATRARPAWTFCENWAIWGLAEYFGGDWHAVYVQDRTRIVRHAVSGGATATLATFTNLSDMCSIAISPTRNRWYYHHEGMLQFGSGDERAGWCPATWDQS